MNSRSLATEAKTFQKQNYNVAQDYHERLTKMNERINSEI